MTRPGECTIVRVVRAPNHLGDAIMAQPAIRAVAALGPVAVQGPPWLHDLLRGIGGARATAPEPLRRGVDEALLFAPSLRVAWQARRARRRVGAATDHRGWLLTDRVPIGAHRSDTYAAAARLIGANPQGDPCIEVPRGPVPDVPVGHVGLNPVVRGGATRQWRGFAALAERLSVPVVFYGGPGEGQAVASIARGRPRAVGLPLQAFGRALSRCAVFVSNDSGAAHFARACGATVVTIFGSTTPEHTGPPGAEAVRGPTLPCAPCYRNRCPTEIECLDIEVERVLAAVESLL